ncbi:unnamed protein product, partial [Meganyctiphanes norvegica]
MEKVTGAPVTSRLCIVLAVLALFYCGECNGAYQSKKLFPKAESFTMVAPLRSIGQSCPSSGGGQAGNCCHRPNDYLEQYVGLVLPNDLVDANLTFKVKHCQCKCLCLDDPLCQVVAIIRPKNFMGG